MSDEAAGFFRCRPGVDAPDVEFHLAPSMFFDEGLSAPTDHGYCFGPVVIKPTSRGDRAVVTTMNNIVNQRGDTVIIYKAVRMMAGRAPS